jgi:protein O-GlcNAc transferase
MTISDDLFHQALASHRRGDLPAATAGYAELLASDPLYADGLHMFAMLRHQQGEHVDALHLLDRALVMSPENPAMLANRASVHLALQDFAAAERDAGEAVRHDAQAFGAWFNLGVALNGVQRMGDAAIAFSYASALRPQHARALLEWFVGAASSGQPSGIVERTHQALPPLAGERDFALRAAVLLESRGYANQALAVLAQLRSELPDDGEVVFRCEVEARFRQATLLEYQRHDDEALAQTEVILAAAPWHRSSRMLRAGLRSERGEIGAALEDYRHILEHVPEDAKVGSAYLIALQHDPDADAASVAQAHRDWAARHMPSVAPRWIPEQPFADPDRPLRVGWLSPRFFGGLVESFFMDELACFDRGDMTHVLYDSGAIDDEATARFRAAADEWRDVEALDDAALGAQIRSDQIDVLVELSGHGPGNRLRALAARPAPVQVAWLDYFHSTGTTAIDVLISDATLSPPPLAANYSERVINLASGRLCYSAPREAPEIVPRGAGPIRFGCFNRLAKINDAVLAVWARILAGVPGSLLCLKARAFDAADMRAQFLGRAASFGIPVERVELLGYSTHRDTLGIYNDVDIALDTFPFSGCATSCDALWMGVPVITRCGQTMVSRQTASLLTTLDLPQWIANDDEEYVACALKAAADPGRSKAQRASLRQRVQTNLGDVQRHADELSEALRDAWRLWCRAEST